MMDLAADQGHHATSVADLCETASVSKRTFYELFDGMDACFAAALETCVAVAITKIDDAVKAAGERSGWRTLLDTSIRTYLETLAAEPKAARAMHIEIINAGPAACAARLEMVRVFADRMRALHSRAQQQEPVPFQPLPDIFEFFVDGLDGRIRQHVLTADAASLTTLAPVIVQAATALFGQRPCETDR